MTLILSGTNGVSDIDGDASTPAIRGTDANTGMFFGTDIVGLSTGGSERMRIDSSGNVGIGVTPSAWGTGLGLVALDIGGAGTVLGTGATVVSGANCYFDGSNWKYKTSTWANRYEQNNGNTGVHAWFTAPSGTAGNNITFTQAMTLDSSGNVGIGTSSPGAKLHVAGSGTTGARVENTTGTNAAFFQAKTTTQTANFGADGTGGFIETVGANPTLFYTNGTERARITSGGYFKASNTGSYWGVSSAYHEFVTSTSNNPSTLTYATNASYVGEAAIAIATRAASSSYILFAGYSGNAADYEFILRGDGNGYADGTWNNNGADYAEFFESANGQALTLGATVVLDGNKVREATDQDPASSVIGVVRPKEPSKASMVVGNTAWNKWANKYLTDDFDRYIMEDHDVVEWEETITDEEGKTSTKKHSYESQNIPAGITVPADATRKTHDENGVKFQHYKLNPAWNPDSEYVNRENRPEWNIIGLLGQVKILKGQPVGDRWIKMRDVSETVEEWMIR